jgi:hypothetical protein
MIDISTLRSSPVRPQTAIIAVRTELRRQGVTLTLRNWSRHYRTRGQAETFRPGCVDTETPSSPHASRDDAT